jgi:hypothetical protein
MRVKPKRGSYKEIQAKKKKRVVIGLMDLDNYLKLKK